MWYNDPIGWDGEEYPGGERLKESSVDGLKARQVVFGGSSLRSFRVEKKSRRERFHPTLNG